MKLHDLIDQYTTRTLIISYLTFEDLQQLCHTDHVLHDLLYSFAWTAKRFFIANSHLNLSRRVLISHITVKESELNLLIDLSFSVRLNIKELTTISKIKLLEFLLPAELIISLQRIRQKRAPFIHYSRVPTFIFYHLSQLYLAKSIEFALGVESLEVESLFKSLFFICLAAVKNDVQLQHLFFARFILDLTRMAIFCSLPQSSDSYIWVKEFHDNCKSFIKTRLKKEMISSFPSFKDVLDKPLSHVIKKCYDIIFVKSRDQYIVSAKVICPEDWGNYKLAFSGISFLLRHIGVNTLLNLQLDVLECLFKESKANISALFQVVSPEHLVHCKLSTLRFMLSSAGIFLISNMQISRANSREFIVSLNEVNRLALNYFKCSSNSLLYCVFRVKDLNSIYNKALLEYRSSHCELDSSPRMVLPDTGVERVNLILSSLEVQGVEGEERVISLLRSQTLKILKYSRNEQHLVLLLREELIGKLSKPHFSLLAQKLLSNSLPLKDLEASLKLPVNNLLLNCKNPNFIIRQFNVDIFSKEIGMLECVVNLMEKNYLFSVFSLKQCSATSLTNLYKNGSLRKILSLDKYVMEYLMTNQFEMDYILDNLRFYLFISRHPYLEKLIKYFGVRFFKQCHAHLCLELFSILKKHLNQKMSLSIKGRYLLLDVFMQAYREGSFNAEYIKTIIQNGFLEEVLRGIKKHAFRRLNLQQITQLFHSQSPSINFLAIFNSLSKKLREVLLQSCLVHGEVDIKKLKTYLARESIQLLNDSVNGKFLLEHFTITDWLALAPFNMDGVSLQLLLVSVRNDRMEIVKHAKQSLMNGNVRYFSRPSKLPIFFSRAELRVLDYAPTTPFTLTKC